MSELGDIERAREKRDRLNKARQLHNTLQSRIPADKSALESYKQKAKEYTELAEMVAARLKDEEEQFKLLDTYLKANVDDEEKIELMNRLADRIEKMKKEVEKKRSKIAAMTSESERLTSEK